MHLKAPMTLHSVAVVAADGNILHDPDYKLTDLRRTEVMLQVTEVSNPTFSLQPQESMDGETWHDVGSAISDVAFVALVVRLPYFKADLVSIADGSVTVVVA